MFRLFLIATFAFSLMIGAAFAQDSTKADIKSGEKITKSADEKAVKKTNSDDSEEPEWITTKSGLMYRDLVVGEGEGAKVNDQVETHYTVWLADGLKPGKKIQSSKDRGQPLEFSVGESKLIAGWNEGATGMKTGGVRQLIIPPDLAWGARGMPPMIPANATVFFELELTRNVSQETAKDKAAEKK